MLGDDLAENRNVGEGNRFMSNELSKVVAGLMAIAALGSSLIAGVDPVQCLLRGGAAWLVGKVAVTIWNVFFTGSSVDPVPVKVQTQIESVPESSTEATTS